MLDTLFFTWVNVRTRLDFETANAKPLLDKVRKHAMNGSETEEIPIEWIQNHKFISHLSMFVEW